MVKAVLLVFLSLLFTNTSAMATIPPYEFMTQTVHLEDSLGNEIHEITTNEETIIVVTITNHALKTGFTHTVQIRNIEGRTVQLYQITQAAFNGTREYAFSFLASDSRGYRIESFLLQSPSAGPPFAPVAVLQTYTLPNRFTLEITDVKMVNCYSGAEITVVQTNDCYKIAISGKNTIFASYYVIAYLNEIDLQTGYRWVPTAGGMPFGPERDTNIELQWHSPEIPGRYLLEIFIWREDDSFPVTQPVRFEIEVQ